MTQKWLLWTTLLAVQVKNDKKKTSLSEITCYNCGGKGHYKSDCPSAKIKKKETKEKELALTVTVIEDEEDKEIFEFWTLRRLKRCVSVQASLSHDVMVSHGKTILFYI